MSRELGEKVYVVRNEWTLDVIDEVALTEDEAEDYIEWVIEQAKHANEPDIDEDEWVIEEVNVADLHDKTTIDDDDNGRFLVLTHIAPEILTYIDPETEEEVRYTRHEVKRMTGFSIDDIREASLILGEALDKVNE